MSKPSGERYRTGALGVLADEFERATEELVQIVEELTEDDFQAVRNPEAERDFRSIQTVINHVVRAGHAHANHVRVAFSLEWSPTEAPLGTRSESVKQLSAMRSYMIATLDGRWEMTDEQIEAVQIESRWGPTYDLEQMLEHAVVHLLRHRHQIERFLWQSDA